MATIDKNFLDLQGLTSYNNKIKELLNNKVDTIQTANIAYGTCSTAADTAQKSVTLSTKTGWKLEVGAIIVVKFTNTNTANDPTLKVGSTDAKSIWYNTDVITTSNLNKAGYENRYEKYMYDGTNYVWIGHSIDDNTTYTPPKLGIGYGTCSTSSGTAYTASMSNYTLVTGGIVTIKFSNAVPASATLNINSKGAKNIYHKGSAIAANVIKAGDYATFIYSTQYHLIAIDRTATADNDTKNTAGSTDSSSKLFLIGATSRAANPQTYSHDTAYVGTDGCLYSGDAKVLTAHQDISGKADKVSSATNGNFAGLDSNGNLTDSGKKASDFVITSATGNVVYGTCSTAAETATKEVTISTKTDWTLEVGDIIAVKFDNTNTAANPKLKVGSTEAKSIWYNTGVITTGSLNRAAYANRYITFIYDGTNWCWLSWSTDENTTDPIYFGFCYGTCSTAAATTAKTVSISNYSLKTNGIVSIKFTNSIPASATLNINSRGAKAIYYKGSAITANIVKAGETATFIYDGSHYNLIAIDRIQPTISGNALLF